MDISSLIGSLWGLAILLFALYETSHGNFVMFYSQEGFLLVFGGSISVVFMAMPMDRLKCVPGFIRRFMFHRATSPQEIVVLLRDLSEKSRREGVLSLESDLPKIKDKSLVQALKMVIDGMDPETIETTIRLEVLAMTERHKAGKKFFDLVKLYGPGWGLVGTLVGQIGMFGNLAGSDPGKLGKLLSIAVCATMYGTVLANAVCGPIGDKLAYRSSEEILSKEMMLQGVMSLLNGDNPRTTIDKMLAFVPQSHREKLKVVA
jgi:chemotaxis protein MotA